ncbi:MAG: T9SS type A sorting domain-containing protein [Bacteroidales bacterium]|jgi:hypothetical protein|nr:T9SS type A sorting domain-containing protein [Bacteroidales bacterium]
MKRFYILLTIAFSTLTMHAQITLENAYPESVAFAYLEGEYYYSVDFINNTCAIYNFDHTLKTVVNFDLATDWYLYDVAFISTKVFNDDELIEMLVVNYKYVAITDTTGYYEYATRVISENGSILLDIPGGGYSDIYNTSEGKSKLMVQTYDFSVSPPVYGTNIYNLPDNDASFNAETSSLTLPPAYPNPSASFINVPYQLNENMSEGTLVITNMNGQEIKRQRIHEKSGMIILNSNNMTPSQYLYFIQSGNLRSGSKKIIVK